MSFINKIRKTKAIFKNVSNFTHAKAYVSMSELYTAFNFNLELNGKFKMVIINYSGDIGEIIKTNYKGFSIKKGRGIIIIINNRLVDLVDNILFQYLGVIATINSVRVYKWGEHSALAKVTQVNRGNMDKDENIISDVDSKFRGSYEPSDIDQERLRNNEKETRNKISKNIIFGLYTSGKKLQYKGRHYKGYYHYHTDSKLFMSGYDYSQTSRRLKRQKGIRKLRRRDGI